MKGPERALVIADFEEERERIDEMLVELTGEDPAPTPPPEAAPAHETPQKEESRTPDAVVHAPALQLSRHRGRIVAWSAGDEEAEPAEQILARLEKVGAAPDHWSPYDRIKLPSGTRAASVSAPVQTSLGWLVSLAATSDDEGLGPSVTWMGLAAALAVRLVAFGRMVPQLEKVGDAAGNRSDFAVRWDRP